MEQIPKNLIILRPHLEESNYDHAKWMTNQPEVSSTSRMVWAMNFDIAQPRGQ